ncbi:HIT family protein [Candidatus Saccharibacteria bacterium]|nr:HIT family protein [Candidatus Saccharibacteria bacterium]
MIAKSENIMDDINSLSEQEKQIAYRDARLTGNYNRIWQEVGKCCFCDIREKYVFFERDNVIMTVSLYAYIDGHLMIVPRRHVRSVKDLSVVEWDAVREMMYIAKKIIREVWGIKSVQYIQKEGADSQGTVQDHLHWHVVPFDAPDLSTWNYRKLEYTPLESAAKYRALARKMDRLSERFDEKYR